MAAFNKFQAKDAQLNAVQQNVADAVEPLAAVPFMDGVLLQSVALESGANQVPHKLGRKLQGWQLLRVRGQATVWDDQDNNASLAERFLKLHASAAVTVDIWVH
jgi:hypothetical protein